MQKTSFILVAAIVLLFKNDFQCNAQDPIKRDQLLNGNNANFLMTKSLNCDCSNLQCDLAVKVHPSSNNKCLFFCCPINNARFITPFSANYLYTKINSRIGGKYNI
jgi:hypothetical protein